MELFNHLGKRSPSREMAKDRLKLVLIQDRVQCTAQVLELLKVDIIKAITKYMDIDEDEMDIQITQITAEDNNGENVPTLYANIPIKGMKKV